MRLSAGSFFTLVRPVLASVVFLAVSWWAASPSAVAVSVDSAGLGLDVSAHGASGAAFFPKVANYAYITNWDNGSVSVIDLATDSVFATVPVGGNPFGVAVSRTGLVYVTNPTAQTVAVIDSNTNTVVATIPMPSGAGGVAVNPSGSRVYVTHNFDGVGSLEVIDAATKAVIASVDVGITPFALVVSPDGRYVYVANRYYSNVDNSFGTLKVVDTATYSVVADIWIGYDPLAVTIHPSGQYVYAVGDGQTVYVVDTDSMTVTAAIGVEIAPSGIAVNNSGTRLYVTNRWAYQATGDQGSISVIDTTTNTVVSRVVIGWLPAGIAVSPDDSRIYTSHIYGLSGYVSVVDAASNTLLKTIPVGTHAYSLGQFILPMYPPTKVAIDIKPGATPNSVSLGSNGTVPVAILSDRSFDATTIDPLTVTLAGSAVHLKGKGTPMASFEDVNGDGRSDLVVHVSTEALQLSESDSEAVLQARTFGGLEVRGADTVRVVP